MKKKIHIFFEVLIEVFIEYVYKTVIAITAFFFSVDSID